MRRLLLIMVAVFTCAAAAAAPAADAVEYCVGIVDPICEDSTNATLQDALDDAGALAGDDVIHLGTGDYSNSDLNVETFSYSPAGSGNDVTIIGRGKGLTTLKRTNAQDIGTFISSADASITFKALQIEVIGDNGIRLADSDTDLVFDGVLITAAAGLPNNSDLVRATGEIRVQNLSEVEGGVSGTRCFSMLGNSVAIKARLEILGSTVSNCGSAVYVQNNTNVFANRSRFIGGGAFAGSYTFKFEGEGSFRIDNSLIVPAANGSAVSLAPGSSTASTGVINQSTLVGANPVDSYGLSGGGAGVGAVEVFDTIVTGFDLPLVPIGETVTTNFTYYDFAAAQSQGVTPSGTDIDAGSTTADPGFVNSGSDPFALVPTSNLRDVDSTANLFRTDEPMTGDLLGLARISNGARDIGAYELQFSVPPPGVGPTPSAAPAFTGSFKFSKSKVRRKKAAKLSYSLTAPATVAFKLKAAKKKNKVPKLKSQAGKAGANTYSVSTKKLKPGKYTLTATLPNGLSKSAKLTVKK